MGTNLKARLGLIGRVFGIFMGLEGYSNQGLTGFKGGGFKTS